MQAVAAEMNLSETAFLRPRAATGYALRWFTPAAEVALCGHATLASAHALWETGRAEPAGAIAFATLSGMLSRRPRRRAGSPWTSPHGAGAGRGAPPGWPQALGARAALDRPQPLRLARRGRLAGGGRAPPRPDMAAPGAGRGSRRHRHAPAGRDGADVTSRYFAPAYGIPEDPVTGSAHCALGPFWAARLGRERLVCHQASARGGIVRVEVRGDRVLLSGRAVTVLERRLVAAPPG